MKLGDLSRSLKIIREENEVDDPYNIDLDLDIDTDKDKSDLDIEKDVGDVDDLEIDIEPPEIDDKEMKTPVDPAQMQRENPNEGYKIVHASQQLDGIISNSHELAKSVQPDKKEKFLALIDRIAEIKDLIDTEFTGDE